MDIACNLTYLYVYVYYLLINYRSYLQRKTAKSTTIIFTMNTQ